VGHLWQKAIALLCKAPPRGRGATIIIAGGGTGGHIFPAIAIANAIKKINPSIEILFIGAKYG
jgi:UDP-N-acetylglucosamine--N-acetylmuramyl-(pentapeptide) pyrophosphoryl-undecaprenol N-acetylglucosamine transferase